MSCRSGEKLHRCAWCPSGCPCIRNNISKLKYKLPSRCSDSMIRDEFDLMYSSFLMEPDRNFIGKLRLSCPDKNHRNVVMASNIIRGFNKLPAVLLDGGRSAENSGDSVVRHFADEAIGAEQERVSGFNG